MTKTDRVETAPPDMEHDEEVYDDEDWKSDLAPWAPPEVVQELIDDLLPVDGIAPNPTVAEATLDAEDLPRWMDCPCYDECLEVASVAGWPGFSCLLCEVFYRNQ